MSQQTITKEFIQNLTSCQGQLYTYILSLLGNSENARDILQETNKSILEKARNYHPGTCFTAWSSKIAYFKVLSFHRDGRRKQVLFSGESLRDIAKKTTVVNENHDARLDELRECIKKLPADRQQLLKQRYEEEVPLESLAEQWSRSYNAIAALLYRVRLSLMDCVQHSLNREDRT